jgi:IclR family pca regulon transcriptional regulator
MGDEAKENALFVASVAKAFDVLEVFRGGGKSLSLTDIIKRTNMGKSAVQRYLFTLEELGYIQKSSITKTYQLSIKNLSLAGGFLSQNIMIQAANPHLVELRKKLDARIGLSVMADNKIIYLIPLQSRSEAFQNDYPGFEVPIYCTTSGRVFLSCCSNEEALNTLENQDITQRTLTTKTDIASIMREIEKAKINGYCITEQEYIHGQLNIAVPIFQGSHLISACIVVVVPASQWDVDKVTKEVLPLLMDSARQIGTFNLHGNS